ncbi:hypothetical protein [Emcibacter sp. SYSU 3D8]|uniref:hypothetical protein n=1 Tax=Emcibacter sp. SYSU 3D8 TaxID=3133969 RepID=UPI0031FF0DA9
MRNSFRLLFTVAAMGIGTMSIGSTFAQEQDRTASPMGTHPMKPTQGQAGAIAADPMALKKAQMTAQQAQTRLNAPPPDALELAKATRSKNVDVAKRILLRNGFSPQQLEGATIVLEDKTGGGPITSESRVKVTIEASCCPLTITIIIRF